MALRWLREHPAAEDRPAREMKALPEKNPAFDWRPFLPLLSFFQGFDDYGIEWPES